jgi:nucleoside-diphosphate-sugar epimerase
MKRVVLAIGANSALAQDVIPLLAQNNQVITAGRKNCDVYCDVASRVTIPAGVDVVLNCAAHFGGTADDEIEAALQTNVLGMLRICEAAKKAKVSHIVQISSIFALLDEPSPFYSVYALSKRQADELGAYYAGLSGIKFTTLRPSRIFGDDGKFQKGQPFLYQMADKAIDGDEIAIYGIHNPVRNYIYSKDLGEIIARVIGQGVVGAYSCVYPANSSTGDIAKAAFAAVGRDSRVAFLPDKPNIPDDTFALDT